MKFTKKCVRLLWRPTLTRQKNVKCGKVFQSAVKLYLPIVSWALFHHYLPPNFLNDQLCTGSLKFGDISNLRQADRWQEHDFHVWYPILVKNSSEKKWTTQNSLCSQQLIVYGFFFATTVTLNLFHPYLPDRYSVLAEPRYEVLKLVSLFQNCLAHLRSQRLNRKFDNVALRGPYQPYHVLVARFQRILAVYLKSFSV